jgi:hypothetical protein
MGNGHYLGGLPPSDVGTGTEVWQIAWPARLSGSSAWVAADDASGCQALYEVIEGAPNRHILKALFGMRLRKTGRIGYNLGKLAPCYLISCSEVGIVRAITRLSRPSAGISTDDALAGEALDIRVEGAAYRYVLE